MAHDMNARTGTSIGTKDHMIPLNMTNAVVSLMAHSKLYDWKHVFAIYVPKTNMPLLHLTHIHQ